MSRQRLGAPTTVRDQHLDRGPRAPAADGGNGGGEGAGPSVVEVVTGDTGHDGMGKAHLGRGLGHPFGLGCVERSGALRGDLAEATGRGYNDRR